MPLHSCILGACNLPSCVHQSLAWIPKAPEKSGISFCSRYLYTLSLDRDIGSALYMPICPHISRTAVKRMAGRGAAYSGGKQAGSPRPLERPVRRPPHQPSLGEAPVGWQPWDYNSDAVQKRFRSFSRIMAITSRASERPPSKWVIYRGCLPRTQAADGEKVTTMGRARPEWLGIADLEG